MQPIVTNFTVLFGQVVPSIIAAIIILIVGWLIALIVSAIVRRVLEALRIDQRLGPHLEQPGFSLARLVSQIVFWLIVLFAVVAALTVLQLTVITGPLTAILVGTIGFLPNLIAAGILAVIAWIIATVARKLVAGLINATKLDARLAGTARMERPVRLGDTLGTIVYWFVWLLFLPTILGALGLQGLLLPVQVLVQEILAFIPNLISAAVILIVGYFVARIVRDIVTNLLAATGIDNLGARAGLGTAPAPSTPTPEGTEPGAPATTVRTYPAGTMTLSGLLGNIVFALILIPAVISALDTLKISSLSAPAIAMLDLVLAAIPRIFAAAVILAIAYLIGRLVAELVRDILTAAGFNRILQRIGLTTATPTGRQPADVAGGLVLVAIMLFAAQQAATVLGFPELTALITGFIVFFANVIWGLVILAIGLYLANLAYYAIRNSDMQNRDVLAGIARFSIVALSATLALRQVGIGQDIVTLAFGLMLGAIAVATALAFGLGGREVASRELNRLVGDLNSRPQPSGEEPPPAGMTPPMAPPPATPPPMVPPPQPGGRL